MASGGAAQQHIDMPFAERLADVVNAMIKVYRDNDPERSSSGTVEGKMRRMGRRDVAVQVIVQAFANGMTEERVRYLIDEGIL